MFSTLLFWDKVLILAFSIFILIIIAAILYVNVPLIQLWMIRKLNAWIEKIETFNDKMRDWDDYDPEWMDYKSWEQTNI